MRAWRTLDSLTQGAMRTNDGVALRLMAVSHRMGFNVWQRAKPEFQKNVRHCILATWRFVLELNTSMCEQIPSVSSSVAEVHLVWLPLRATLVHLLRIAEICDEIRLTDKAVDGILLQARTLLATVRQRCSELNTVRQQKKGWISQTDRESQGRIQRDCLA